MKRTILTGLVLASLFSIGACVDGGGDGDDGDDGDDDGTTSSATSGTPSSSPSSGAGTAGAGGDDDDGGQHTCGDIPNPDDCAGQWSCGDDGWICEPAPGCPQSVPEAGTACDADETCTYSTAENYCGRTEATCTAGQWAVAYTDLCDDPRCPESEPRDGDACDADGAICEYEDPDSCGAQPTYACEDGAWDHLPDQIGCDLDCRSIDDEDVCANLGCRWLEPASCPEDQTNLEIAGCYDFEPCTDETCSGAEECLEIAVDPDCADEGCDACAVTTFICQDVPEE